MPRRTRTNLKPYAVAVLSVFVATVLTQLLQPFLGSASFAFFYAAVAVSAWYGGIKPGLLAIALSTIAISYFFLTPIHSIKVAHPGDFLRLGVTALVTLLIAYLTAELRRAKQRIEQLSKQQLQASQTQLSLVLSATQMGMWDWNLLTGEITWSPEHEQLFGLAPGTFDGRYETFDERLHPDDRDALNTTVNRAIQEKGTYQHEYRLVWADGSIHWVEGRGQAFYDETGQAVRMTGTVMDISDRKNAEIALQDSEERYRSLITATVQIVWTTDEYGNTTSVSPAWFDLTGQSLDEVRQWGWVDYLHPDDRDRALLTWKNAVATRTSYEIEYRFLSKDGNYRDFLVRGVPVLNPEGSVREWVGTCTDITDRKAVEAALVSSERRLRTIIEAEPECVKVLTADGALLNMNPAGLAMIEADNLEQVRGQSVCPIVAPANRQAFVNLTRQVARGKSGILEFEIVGLKGTRRWLESHAVPLQDQSGAITEILAVTRDITQRKQAEAALQKAKEELEIKVQQRTAELSQANELLQREQEALQQSESTLRSFFDSASMMMGIVELMDDDILHISDNAATAKLFGLTPEAMQNRKASDLGAPQEFLQMWSEHYREAERTQSPVRFEYSHETDQTQRWLSATVSLIALSPSKRPRFAYVVEDISDRKLAEEERDKLINILEAASDFIASASVEQQVRYLNGAARKLFGFAQDEDFTNFSVSDTHPNWALEIVRDQGIPSAVKDGVWLGENAFLSHDGREIPISQLIIAHQGANGNVKHFSTIARDITQQKQTEATLREAERRWRYLLENVRLVVVGLDITGKVEFANAFFLELTGYTQAEALGKDWFETFLPLQAQQQVHTAFQEVLEREFHPYYTNVILTQSGEERIIAWNNTQLRNLQGEVVGTMSIGEDITERHAVEKMKNEFISIVSHELRTPLTSIRGSLGMLATGALNNHPQRMQRMIEIAAIDTERLVRLVNDILDLERLDSGKINLVKECCDAAALIQQSAEAMRSLAQKENITLSVSSVPALVWASSDHIIQTLTNLLSNAIKFSPPNSTITLTIEPQDNCVLFQVKDQGRGIPVDKLETIFGRFQQVDASDSRKQGGTGLGLAICRSIITQHGGQIWVESVLGEGSTFYFTLPVSAEHT